MLDGLLLAGLGEDSRQQGEVTPGRDGVSLQLGESETPGSCIASTMADHLVDEALTWRARSVRSSSISLRPLKSRPSLFFLIGMKD